MEILSDAYVGLLGVVILGAMAGNLLLGIRSMFTAGGCDAACGDARSLLGMLSLPLMVLATHAAARLVGPVFLPPAAGGWLVSAPVERGELLRPPLARGLLIAAAAAATLTLPTLLLAAPTWSAGLVLWAIGVTASVGTLAQCALSQSRGDRAHLVPALIAAGTAFVIVAVLTVTARGTVPSADPDSPTVLVTGLILLLALAGWSALRVRTALRAMDTMPRSALTATQDAWPSLSGALAALDLALLHDVVVSRRWRSVGWLESRRGGPSGWWALAHSDARRLRRSPKGVLVLVACLPLGFATTPALGPAGSSAAMAVVGFLVGASLFTGLRVVSRTPAAARMLPFPTWATRAAHLVVPGSVVMLWALATTAPAALDVGGTQGWLTSLGASLSAVAAATHWVAAAPPDHGRPMLITPAGGLPPGLVTALTRGINVSALTAIFLLVPGWGTWVSLAISSLVLLHHLSSSPQR